GAGPVGLVAALTHLQNDIPVRIIDKDPNPRIGQRDAGIWPRPLEVFNFLDVPEVKDLGVLFPLHKLGTKEPSELQRMFLVIEPTPAIPFFIPKMWGQDLLELTLRRHLEKCPCFVETGTEMQSFKQSGEEVTAVLAKTQGEDGILETFTTKWMIGADGAKGVVRKQLGLTFQGETRDDFHMVTGDICLTCAGLNRVISPYFIRRQHS
ncbi:FAD/NAD(P)-binding domain-containing protein, partial [Rhizopogon vinicolor AM-OR11-026]